VVSHTPEVPAQTCCKMVNKIYPLAHWVHVTQLPEIVEVTNLLVVAVAVQATQLRTGFQVVPLADVVAVPPHATATP